MTDHSNVNGESAVNVIRLHPDFPEALRYKDGESGLRNSEF